MKTVSVVFGLDPELPMDRSEFGRFELELGPVKYFVPEEGGHCDFGEPMIQQAVYNICADFAKLEVAGVNADGDVEYLVRQGSGLEEKEVNCWLLEFKNWSVTIAKGTARLVFFAGYEQRLRLA